MLRHLQLQKIATKSISISPIEGKIDHLKIQTEFEKIQKLNGI